MRPVIALSFPTWLHHFADGLERGAYRYDATYNNKWFGIVYLWPPLEEGVGTHKIGLLLKLAAA